MILPGDICFHPERVWIALFLAIVSFLINVGLGVYFYFLRSSNRYNPQVYSYTRPQNP